MHAIDLQKGDQKTPEFLKLNPNGRIPVIVDTEVDLTIIESGAQLINLAENILNWIPKGTHDYNKLIKPEELKNLFAKYKIDPLIRGGI